MGCLSNVSSDASDSYQLFIPVIHEPPWIPMNSHEFMVDGLVPFSPGQGDGGSRVGTFGEGSAGRGSLSAHSHMCNSYSYYSHFQTPTVYVSYRKPQIWFIVTYSYRKPCRFSTKTARPSKRRTATSSWKRMTADPRDGGRGVDEACPWDSQVGILLGPW